MNLYSVRISSNSKEKMLNLKSFNLDLQYRVTKKIDTDYYEVPGILSDNQIDKVKQAGYQVDIIDNLNIIIKERQGDKSSSNRFITSDFMLEEETVRGGYMTVEEIETALQQLANQFPNLVTLIQLPNQTWEGRTSHAIRLKAGTNSNRTGVLFTGSVHAREWGGSDICINFLRQLITAYQSHTSLSFGNKTYTFAQVRTFMEKLDIFVFPDVNLDGKHHSQTAETMWRKNRNPNTSTGGHNLGVDINRNFDFLWTSGIGTSNNPTEEIYKGTAPFSEPETKNDKYLLDTYPNIQYYVDIHSHGGFILCPWGDDDNQETDPKQNFQNPIFDGKRGKTNDTVYREYISSTDQNAFVDLAKKMNKALHAVRGKSYTVQQGIELYATSATAEDYAYSRNFVDPNKKKVYAFTIEFGQEFIPPYEEMLLIIKDVNAAMTELCFTI
ncbi:M14 family metallopeptidase [Bacillus thuringiensis]|uniref:carboxypeptidase T n=1 Tax=Bacillus thuringiensis TaxID=1428 RepID=A0AAW9GMX6_BACTU|nr:M14 family metallopeptidase [Bacillus thuringiensis]MDY0853910.1 M14 family metallopeptidase [Bacillus thuringiensis]MDY4393873.1 M14 family metallopeptidase [Bacillus thuringiensis]MDY7962633.1 M14 family metallopeptidase [Bacillus thuringiensis]